MSGPLSGRRIVVTRSAADNVSLVDALEPLGAEVIELPLVQVVGPADGGLALRAAIDHLDRYRYVLLTSVNGVDAVAEALGSRAWPPEVVAVPVGPVTAGRAADAGMVVGRAPSVATVATLVAEFPDWDGVGSRRILAPLAELAGNTAVVGLTARGYEVERCEAYRTVAPPHEITAEPVRTVGAGVDAVLFFSPSAVDRFVALTSNQRGPGGGPLVRLAVCIGPSTGARADQHGHWEVVVADPHTQAGVIDALLDHPV